MSFQQSLDNGEVPKDWRRANITAIYKKSNRQDPPNYRPVSLTSVSCKTLEHIIFSHTMGHLDHYNILVHFQHRFRSKSKETQLILTIDDMAKNLFVNRLMDMCILDFSKAFDRVPHQRLMAKLEYYGIRGQTRSWIEKWLTSRVQQVVVDGEISREEIVRSGVPQGMVLEPLMFLIFINDIGYNISSTIHLFADDALIYRYVKNKEDSDNL